MVDFIQISARSKGKVVEIYPKFIIGKTKDLMIKGGDFYAIWIEEKGLWSTDEQDVITLIDNELTKYANEHKSKFEDDYVNILYMHDADSGTIDRWHKYVQKQMRDTYKDLDTSLIFSNQKTNKDMYASKTLSYPLMSGNCENYEKLISTLYDEDERRKIEWAIGAIVTGDSKHLQKFLVLYGPPGSGKSTILNIIQMLFDGYYTVFEAAVLGSPTAQFAMEQFKSNPLVAIQQDGDLSKIEDNTRLNSLISHELMVVNEKHKSLYSVKFRCMCLLGTNKFIKITDSQSGMLRRLIDVVPSGRKLPNKEYEDIMGKIPFELSAIAYHCKRVYTKYAHYYDSYKPIRMMGESNDFFNFILDSYFIFEKEDGVSLKQAWELYKMYCTDSNIPYPLTKRVFKTELANYFRNYSDRVKVGDEWVRSWYSGFKYEMLNNTSEKPTAEVIDEPANYIDFKEQKSNLDILCADCPAQYGTDAGIPKRKWDNVTTKLSDLDTAKLHYLKVPENHIVIDFDLKDEDGNKSFERNLKEASKWPKTYAELSKSGGGIHLHYIYNGDTSKLSRLYADDIEIKIFTGNSSLRRKLTKCNSEPINAISSGLPIKKGEGKMVNFETINNEKALRTIIKKNLRKEIHPATKPSIDFIYKVLEDAYESGMVYDVSDLYNAVLSFANASTNQSEYCLKLVTKMHFKSDLASESVDYCDSDPIEKPITMFDIEIFPNVSFVNFKQVGDDKPMKRFINPKPSEIEALIKNHRLVGFNCRGYDNHILYAMMLGYTNMQLYTLSQKLVGANKKDMNGKYAGFLEAYNISYTDIYDYASKKQKLKKWELELMDEWNLKHPHMQIKHHELGLKWDQPVPEELWPKVSEYCDDDVYATEATWFATQAEFKAREILVELVKIIHGIDANVNMTTNTLSAKIIFGNNKTPQLNYVAAQEQLRKEFPEYEFKQITDDGGKTHWINWYRNTDLGFGGYVYASPGMYGNIDVEDVASMHPTTIEVLKLLGEEGTKLFSVIKNLRIDIKHKEFDKARHLFEGKLAPYLEDEDMAKGLAGALKIVINSVYGLTSAKFDNPFTDRPNNANNIVALRGALMMRTLQDEVTARGFKVVHIKTDSIKIADATPEIIQFVREFGKKYGYNFETEDTFDRICLVNDAVYIAKDKEGQWHATGAQFAVPYVFKKCFSKEPIEFKDMCEIKEVQTAMFLDFGEGKDLRFVGKVGSFTPIKLNCGGGLLVKEQLKKDGSIGMDAVTGTKGYQWLESSDVSSNLLMDSIDKSYYEELVNKAVETINKYGDYEWFVSDDPYQGPVYVNGRPDYSIGCPF